ncbi:MAG: polyprenyl synthetase family protein, partial [Eubacterium sp.]|nr:polyprenyl synthetase family protein [Eubacterium sp.]
VIKKKTAALFAACSKVGVYSSDSSDEMAHIAYQFGELIGIAFQIKDDLLDIEGDEEELGKPVGSDAKNDKTTYVTLVGEKKAEKDVKKLTQSALKQLEIFKNKDFIILLSDYLVSRNN